MPKPKNLEERILRYVTKNTSGVSAKRITSWTGRCSPAYSTDELEQTLIRLRNARIIQCTNKVWYLRNPHETK
jgi:hypothetical protein